MSRESAPNVSILPDGKGIRIEFNNCDDDTNDHNHQQQQQQELTCHATWLYSNAPTNLHIPSGQRKKSPGQLFRSGACVIQNAQIMSLDHATDQLLVNSENADNQKEEDINNYLQYLVDIPNRSVHSRVCTTKSPPLNIESSTSHDKEKQDPTWILCLQWKDVSCQSTKHSMTTTTHTTQDQNNNKTYYNVNWLQQWAYDQESLLNQRHQREITPSHTFMEKAFTNEFSFSTQDFDVDKCHMRRYKRYLGLQHFEFERIIDSGNSGTSGTSTRSSCGNENVRNSSDDDKQGLLLPLLDAIFSDGAALITNIPSPTSNSEDNSDHAVTSIAKLVAGSISHNHLYGDTFHVKSVPNANNVAYTSHALSPHQDLVYYESKPGLQLLHCISNSQINIDGGESILIDAMAAAYRFRQVAPALFETLVRCPATFVKERDGAKMTYVQPHIVLKEDGNACDGSSSSSIDREIVSVHWAPPFEGPLNIPPSQVDDYYEAYAAFELMLDSAISIDEDTLFGHEEGSHDNQELSKTVMEYAKKYTWEYRLKPGEMIIFNNERMLHGRRGFQMINSSLNDGGGRHLCGGYTNIDDTLNTYRTMLKERNSQKSILNVGNGSVIL